MRHLTRLRRLSLLMIVLCLLLVSTTLETVCIHASSFKGVQYRIFCVNNKLDIGTRSLEDMRLVYGASVCVLAEFDVLEQAQEDLRRRGGVGAACKC